MVQGKSCPEAGSKNLTFSFDSNILGKSQMSFGLEVKPSSTIPKFNFTYNWDSENLNEDLTKSGSRLNSNFTEPSISI